MQSNNQGFLDVLTIFSLGLQMAVYEQTQRQATTDDLMRELQKQDREYFDKIIENQNKIMGILSELKQDMSAEQQYYETKGRLEIQFALFL